jgi:hypothetical protein
MWQIAEGGISRCRSAGILMQESCCIIRDLTIGKKLGEKY